MSTAIIQARDLGKLYRIGSRARGYKTLRDQISGWFGLLGRNGGARAQARAESEFWALREIAFDVNEGDVIGVVGRNGAGKSTLLKVLSRITSPTTGSIEIRGRVGSLLEVGTGFHPELTGRENTYMNGAILGMSQAEINSKFDDIVDFAEVAKFIDTPVKHYSSGMYLRLAFAVAAHLEPEILIVDEVLAVGDAAFQKKCLGKMGEVAARGRTVLFVSHNMVAVEKLCTRGIVLDQGRLAFDGSASDAVARYLQGNGSLEAQDLRSAGRRGGSGEVRITRYEVISATGALLRAGQPITIRLHFECHQRISKPSFAVSIVSRGGQVLFSVYTSDLGYDIPEIVSDGHIDLEIPHPNLLAGSYLLHFGIADDVTNQWYDLVTEGAELEIEAADVYGTGRQRAAAYSLLFYPCRWSLTTAAREVSGPAGERS
ncbi:MAG TPA: ABC transporter ATP-binding protein [Solibacterales bacterium]|nr:ABC transporter ATP-binding protein [Bryobacterales bacterium]